MPPLLHRCGKEQKLWICIWAGQSCWRNNLSIMTCVKKLSALYPRLYLCGGGKWGVLGTLGECIIVEVSGNTHSMIDTLQHKRFPEKGNRTLGWTIQDDAEGSWAERQILGICDPKRRIYHKGTPTIKPVLLTLRKKMDKKKSPKHTKVYRCACFCAHRTVKNEIPLSGIAGDFPWLQSQ